MSETMEEVTEELEGKPVETPEQTEEIMALLIPKRRPNFFIAFQIHDLGILQNVKKLQAEVTKKNPVLCPALVNVSTLHVTLAVFYFPTDSIKNLKEKLDQWAVENVKTYFEKPWTLSFKGVRTFSQGVGYVDIEPCENYDKLLDVSLEIKEVLTSAGCAVTKEKLIPHLTFMKLSKDRKLFKLKKDFREVFKSLSDCDEHFGKQQINELQLLSMNEPKDERGYYKCYHQINVSDVNTDES